MGSLEESVSDTSLTEMGDEFDEFDASHSIEADGDDTVKDEGMDTVPELFTKDLLDQIREKKASNPGMFVSAWEEDEFNIAEKKNDSKELFLTAAEEGNLEKVVSMLMEDPSIVMVKDMDEYTALHRASYNNHVDVISFLLEHGADAEARTCEGWTPLHSAANWANYQAIGRLLSHGVDANAKSNGNVTALHLAISSKADDLESVFHSVRFLLEAPGIDASAMCGSNDTPLMLARRHSQRIYQMIKDHLEK